MMHIRYDENVQALPAPSVILSVANVVFKVHLDLITEALDPVHVAQATGIRIKEHNSLPRVLVVAQRDGHVFVLTLRQANSVSSIWIALNGITSSFMTRTPISLTTVSCGSVA